MLRDALLVGKHLVRKRGMLPVYLIVGSTYRCNARCITCFNHEHLNPDPATSEGDLTLDEWRRIAPTLGPKIWILYTGGEPLLREDLPHLTALLSDATGASQFTIPINGLLPERAAAAVEETLRRAPRIRLTASLSLDGIGAIHDAIRGVEGNFQAMRATYDALARVRASSPRFSLNVNTVLMDRNLAHIPELCAFVRREMPAVDFHGFELLRGHAPDATLHGPSAQQYAELLPVLQEHWSHFAFYRMPGRRWVRAGKLHARDTELRVLEEHRQVIPCSAGKVSGVIDPTGAVKVCEERPEIVGRLRAADYDFAAVWRSAEAERVRQSVERGECWCTHSCFVGTSALFDLREYPAIARKALAS
jgi:molybdenum cofactor biosynthesis enzyme MoaA